MFSGAMQQLFSITHPSDIAAVRRHAVGLAGQLGLNDTIQAKLAVVVTEATTNILKHCGNGTIILTPFRHGAANAIGVLALDSGPGIANLASCLRDGMSTSGTCGTGLGAMRRLSSLFDAYTAIGKGSAFFMCLRAEAKVPEVEPAIEYGAVCVPMRGEEECGDNWAMTSDTRGATFLVADGLGHGPEAARASLEAVHVLKSHPELAPLQLIDAIHHALIPTRGAAVTAVRVDVDAGQLHCVGVGNIGGSVVTPEWSKCLISHDGIVGHIMRKVQQFSLPLPQESVCVLHSDGLATQWDLAAYPGLLAHHSALIAGVLYRDFGCVRDDVTVVVFRPFRHG